MKFITFRTKVIYFTFNHNQKNNLRANLKSTEILRGIWHLQYIPLVIFLFLSTYSYAGKIVDIASIKVSKSYPASFVIDLEKGDIITVKYAKVGGKADIAKMTVQVIDLNKQDEVVAASFQRSGRDFLAPYDGKFRIDFTYNGKSGLLRTRYLDISLSIDLDGFDGLEEGESREMLHCVSCTIEDSEQNAFRMNYFLNKGDKMVISSADSKAPFLKLKVTQLAKMFSLGGPTTITVPKDGIYSFKFYLEEDSENAGLFNWKELLQQNDFLFNDLSIFRERAIDMEALARKAAENNSNNSEDLLSNSDDPNSEETDPFKAFDFEAIMADQSKSAEERNRLYLEAMREQQTLMLEIANRKNIRVDVSSIPGDIEMDLEPEFNFATDKRAGNRQCQEIAIQPTDFDVWFYWIGVGNEAEKAYDEHNDNIYEIYNAPLSTVAAENIYATLSQNPNAKKRKNPGFPTEVSFPDYLYEDVEYAIVDFNNKQKFLAGQRYSKLNSPSRKTTYVTADNGFSVKAPMGAEMYFCACNNNKATPIHIFFKYFAIDPVETEY